MGLLRDDNQDISVDNGGNGGGMDGLEGLEVIQKVSKDVKKAALLLSREQVRFLVEDYYLAQENRIRTDAQIRAMQEKGLPYDVLTWQSGNNALMENELKKLLGAWSANNPVGQWSLSICGIGPVISAGLLAHIDIERAPTVGHIWSFAGLDPSVQWLGRKQAEEEVSRVFGEVPKKVTAAQVQDIADQLKRTAATLLRDMEDVMTGRALVNALAKRPWNEQLKTLCTFKMGECFVKVSGNKNDVYGKYYLAKKAEYQGRNENGGFKETAAKRVGKVGHGTDAFKWYQNGKLPPAHIHAMARRYAVKLFLAHWHEVAYKEHFKKDPPNPYAIAILGHAHKIEVPQPEKTKSKTTKKRSK